MIPFARLGILLPFGVLSCVFPADAAEAARPCVFCEIAAGRAAQADSIVYRDELVVAFMDRAPRNPGHVLVVPVQHADGILDVPGATLGRIAEVVQRIARAVKKTDLPAEGLNVLSNTGPAAGQSVFHLHFHVIPRFAGEPPSPGEKHLASPAELAAVAAKIRSALASEAPAAAPAER